MMKVVELGLEMLSRILMLRLWNQPVDPMEDYFKYLNL